MVPHALVFSRDALRAKEQQTDGQCRHAAPAGVQRQVRLEQLFRRRYRARLSLGTRRSTLLPAA